MNDESALIYLRAIQEEFLQELPERVREMEAAWESMAGDLSREILEDLRRKAHTLRGEGATFGFLWISQAAEKVGRAVGHRRQEGQERAH